MNGYNLDKNKCIALLIFGFVATSIGGFIRLYLPLEANFPLNDGGLFYTFIKDIIDSNFKLPFYTSYNYYQIPFAYPPLSFYMIASISFIFKMDLLFAIRLVPPIITIFTIPAFFLFSYSYYKNAVNVIFAVFSYVFLPWSYMWLIMGGGVSRSVGAFFGILSLHSIFLLYTKRKKIFIFSSGIFSSLTILSHLGVSAFVFMSALIFILFLGRNRTSIIYSLYVGILVLVLTSPWWFIIITRHGIEPILSALNSGYGDYRKYAIINLIFFRFTGEISLTILGVLCMYGVFLSVFDREYFLPVWLLAIFIAIPRASPEYATIPAALLISKGIYQIVIPIFKKKSNIVNNNKAPSLFLDSVLIFYILFLLLLSAIFNVYGPCKELSIDDRDAMAWVDANTNIESEFVVINVSSEFWANDSISEWFPVLAQRKVLNLVQGSEWLGNGQFHKKWRLNKELIKCVDQESTCIQNILDSYKIKNIYIFISRNDEPIEKNLSLAIPIVENSMHKNKIFKLIFQNNKVSIFKNQRLS